MFDAIVLWLHILGAVAFIGPQIFLAAIAMPAIRSVSDTQTRQALTRSITRGFGMLGGGALVLLLLTGLWNFQVAQDNGRFDLTRFFWAFNIKFMLFLVVVVLTGLHAMVFGKRLQELQERGASEAELAEARRQSMIASITTLVLSLVILLLGAMMSSESFLSGSSLRD
jgi:uncharacterized membrane protein